MLLLRIGLIPLGILIYGLVSKKRWALWVGGVWLAFSLVLNLTAKKP